MNKDNSASTLEHEAIQARRIEKKLRLLGFLKKIKRNFKKCKKHSENVIQAIETGTFVEVIQ